MSQISSGELAAITEDFDDDLNVIRLLTQSFDDPSRNAAKVRIAAANSATLLLAATFEEYVREMARVYAKTFVSGLDTNERLPVKLLSTAWRRTLKSLLNLQVSPSPPYFTSDNMVSDPKAKFEAIYEFCRGDLSQDVFDDLIYNENNMRSAQINSLFKVSNLHDICLKISNRHPLQEFFGEEDAGKVHSRLVDGIDGFIKRRNDIAHSLNTNSSSAPDQIGNDIEMFDAFGKSLCETLENQ